MSKTKNFIIDLQLYKCDVMVSVGENDEQLFKKLRKYEIKDYEFEHIKYKEYSEARFCLFECGALVIRIRKVPKTPVEYGSLQHEIFHCVTGILWRIGMKLKIKTSDEAYSYLCGFLTTEIYKRL